MNGPPPDTAPPAGQPDYITRTGGHITITTETPADALTACTCGHRCTNPTHTAAWAHTNHTRRHRTRKR